MREAKKRSSSIVKHHQQLSGKRRRQAVGRYSPLISGRQIDLPAVDILALPGQPGEQGSHWHIGAQHQPDQLRQICELAGFATGLKDCVARRPLNASGRAAQRGVEPQFTLVRIALQFKRCAEGLVLRLRLIRVCLYAD